jgi:DNA-binding HxlR family transcriptional regulator
MPLLISEHLLRTDFDSKVTVRLRQPVYHAAIGGALAKSYGQFCPIALTLDIIGERWTMIIIRDLYFGRTRFNQLLESSQGMSTKILSERLKLLEQHGLVERIVYNEHPLRAEYRLTAKGMSLEPVLNAIGEWGAANLMKAADARKLTKQIGALRPRGRAGVPTGR